MLSVAAMILACNAPPAPANGIIIPAYLPLSNTADWNVLKEDASIFTKAQNPIYTNYWVIVNGSNNGPYSSAADWATATTLWDPITANGGKIFGYVHTLAAPASATFRPLSDVKTDIKAWVKGP